MGWVVALQMVYTPKEHYFAFTDSAALPVPTTTLMAPRSAGPQLFQASQARQKQEKVFAGGRTRVQPGLDPELLNAPVLHFPMDHKRGLRWLCHFYSVLWWDDPRLERGFKRLARDALRYRDEVFCAAAAAIQRLRRDPQAHIGIPAHPMAMSVPHLYGTFLRQNQSSAVTFPGEGAPGEGAGADGSGGLTVGATGLYSSYHIRRGDFQFKAAKVEASQILDSTRSLMQSKELLYVATDESNHQSFLAPFRDAGFLIRTLDDVLPPEHRKVLLSNPNWIGMVEQVIASQGRIFVGTWWSTFSGFIVRMRAYQVIPCIPCIPASLHPLYPLHLLHLPASPCIPCIPLHPLHPLHSLRPSAKASVACAASDPQPHSTSSVTELEHVSPLAST